jgi:hypothetical protein
VYVSHVVCTVGFRTCVRRRTLVREAPSPYGNAARDILVSEVQEVLVGLLILGIRHVDGKGLVVEDSEGENSARRRGIGQVESPGHDAIAKASSGRHLVVSDVAPGRAFVALDVVQCQHLTALATVTYVSVSHGTIK